MQKNFPLLFLLFLCTMVFMKIEKNAKVVFNYTIKDSAGMVLGASSDYDPASYIHGYNLLLPKLEDALNGKEAGDTFDVAVSPEEGYGEHMEDLVIEVDKAIFHADGELAVGMEFQDEHSGNVVRVVELRGDKVLVDANHPFAGKDLLFSVKVENVDKAEAAELEELQQMLAHHSHGCSCGCGDEDCGEDSCGCDCCSGGCH